MKRQSIVLMIAVLCLGGTACTEVLDQEPKDTIGEDIAFEDADDVEAGILGVYSAVSGSNLVALASRSSDELRRSDENRGQGIQMHNWTYNSSTPEPEGLWINNYVIVNRANRVLAAIESLKNERAVGANQVDYQEAEAYALRAMAHFDLWRVFSYRYSPEAMGIPYVTLDDTDGNGRPDGLDPFALPSRRSTAEVFSLIESDLQNALNLMPNALSSTASRFDRASVLALSARVAQYKEDWDAAEDFASQALNLRPLESRSQYPSIWTDNTVTGVILKMTRVTGEGRIGTLFRDLNGDVFFHPSIDWLSQIDGVNDIRYEASVTIDPDRQGGDPQEELVGKYDGKQGLRYLNDIKLIRSAEMLLIRAEARARKSNRDLDGANEDLTRLRTNRIPSYFPDFYTDPNELLNQILLERRIELAFEGHRWFDLKRNGLGVTRTGQDCHINCSLNAGDFRYALPVPQSEIFANDNIVQNDEY
ncbi:RagB/SusD family nutrient uptake outer membrane protein [Echinicola sediminis]